jgi:hypothetical protein
MGGLGRALKHETEALKLEADAFDKICVISAEKNES